MTQDERDKLFSPSGLDIREVSPDRRAAVDKPITRRNAKFLLNSDAQIIMRGERVQKEKQFEYTFTATTSEGLDPIVWKFTTPKYEPPKKEEPANKSNSTGETKKETDK